MQKIDSSAIRGGELTTPTIRPAAVGAVCPYCNSMVVFSISGYTTGPMNSVAGTGSCPSCKKFVGFWSVNDRLAKRMEDAQLYMHPAPKSYFAGPDELDAVPEPLRRALFAAIDSYNAGIYAAAAVSGRRALEGTFKFLLPEEKRGGPLYKLIETATQQTDLSAPLKALSHAIRSGGNLGAHFDMEREPDEAVARQIVELLSYLISYLYILPARITQLEDALGKIAADEGGSS